jgi:EAL domain-containing protein (putative c-di-GMP-specific phosphodiesterase class I)
MPGKFIPQCEKSGMITRLDQYLWEEVCRTLRGWLDQGYDPVPVSVNVSRRDFYEIDVPGYFSDLVKKYGIESRYLEIEITESAFVEDAEVLQEAERKFHELGFTVLIDDFGSGYSSLNMLKDIQADVLKLDMKFLDLNSKNLYKGKEIVRSIFDMANTLNYKVIAEGVETKEQLNTLQSIGCDYVQGYYFYHPLPVKEYERLLPKGA